MSVTAKDIAEFYEISRFTVRSWVARKQLHPIKPGAHPLRFKEAEVVECYEARVTRSRHTRLDACWAEIFATEVEGLESIS